MEILILVFVLLFIVIGFLIFVKNNKPALEKEDTFPYFKISALLTPAELSFYHVLKIAVSEQYDIFAKVRLADLVSVKKGVDRAVWGKHFNKIKAKHIDFILCEKNTSEILCAIELDDQSHSQIKRQERDEFVTKVLDVVTLPFARFDVTRTYQSDAVKKHIQLAIAPEVIVKVTDNPSIKVLIEPDIDALNITTERKCPKCRGELVLRKFTRGQKKGHSFWGCSNFPQCRYMVDTL
tara:strand:- start:8462 stop:9172 length:711 start_codon:yes stop_codon:yes gene_type:complete